MTTDTNAAPAPQLEPLWSDEQIDDVVMYHSYASVSERKMADKAFKGADASVMSAIDVRIIARNFRNRYERDRAQLAAQYEDKISRFTAEYNEVEQTLGKALGYPFYCDDQANFPGATIKDGVCVGEHVPATLALEAAQRIEQLAAQVEALQAESERLRQASANWQAAFRNVSEVMGKLASDNTALRQQVEASGEWEVVKDGDHLIEEDNGGYGWKIRVNGQYVAMISLPYFIFLDKPREEVDLPVGWKLIRRKESAGGSE